MIDTAKAKKWSMPGLLCAELPGGIQIAGVISLQPHGLIKPEVRQVVVAFRFCPWCGKEMPFWDAAKAKDMEKPN